MLILIYKRALSAVGLLFLASLLCFTLVVSAPGNIAILIAELRNPGASTADIRVIEEELGLNNPLPVRYYDWLKGVLNGDFGIAYKTGEPVGKAITSRLSTTGTLVAGGFVVSFLLSFLLGFSGALRPYGFIDSLTRFTALLGASTPSFFVGAVLIYAFAVDLGIFPTFGFSGPLSWVLPWFTIGVLPASILSRVVRVGLEDAMSKPFAITAKSKGFTRSIVLFRDAIPNILPTYINSLGAQASLMIVSTIVIEPLFAWHGVGDLFLQGVKFRDFMVVQAGLLIFVCTFIILNLTVDILMIMSDPKLRRQGSQS